MEPLRTAGVACGVLHPLQSIVGDTDPVMLFRGITCVVAGDRRAVEWGTALAGCLGASAVSIDAGALPAYHAGAVLASRLGLVEREAAQIADWLHVTTGLVEPEPR